MELLSDDKTSTISFQVLGFEVEHYPSANLLVKVTDDGFSGSALVWVGADEWDAFVEQLRRCEQNRCGSASLASMDPGEFTLRIEKGDSLGHLVARFQLTQRHLTRAGNVARTLTGGFDLDSEFFAQTVQEFTRFAGSVRNPGETA